MTGGRETPILSILCESSLDEIVDDRPIVHPVDGDIVPSPKLECDDLADQGERFDVLLIKGLGLLYHHDMAEHVSAVADP